MRLAESEDPDAWQLLRTPTGMMLRSPAAMGALQLEVSLVLGRFARRLRSSRRSEPLPRAIGLTGRQDALTVVDATGGLCRDALVLAQLGCRVTAIERIAAFALLVEGAIEGSPLAERLRVVVADSIAWLDNLGPSDAPQVVYLDPMFDEHGTAQVKKDMQICRALAGPPDRLAELLAAARSRASDRVVVKRSQGASPLAPDVSFSIDGERVRFDVYVPR